MRALLWFVAAACLAGWSAIVWAGLALVDTAAGWVPTHPLATALVASKWTDFAAAIGHGAMVLVWLLGAVAIAVLAVLIDRGLALTRGLAAAIRGGGRRSAWRSSRLGRPLFHRLAGRLSRHVRPSP